MAGIVALIEATPRRAVDGSPVVVRLCWNAAERADFFGVQWYPGVFALPTFETRLAFDGQKFGQGATPTVGGLVITLDPVTAPFAALVWKNAPITLSLGVKPPVGDPAAFAVAWSGRCDAASEKDSQLTIVMLDAGQVLRVPLQPVKFGSSGSALLDGPDAVDKAGQQVPVGWGALSAVPAILVDKSYGIWLVLGRPATAIGSIEDGGYPLTLGVARAGLADLRANVPAAGAADYCLDADGLVIVRPWTAPTYPLIVDLVAGGTSPTAIAAAIVGARSGLAFTAGTLAAFDALTTARCQLYITDAKTVAEALDLLFPPLGAFWKLNSAGTIDLGRLAVAGAATRDLGGARTGAVTRLATVMPTGRRTLGYATNNRVLGTNEIAKALTADNADAVGGVPAATIAAEIAAAAHDGATALNELTDIASDGVLTPSEKATAIRDADVIAGEQANLDAQALAFGITTEKLTYDAAVTSLAGNLGGLVAPVPWNDLTGNTAVDGPAFRGWFDAAFRARTGLLVAMATVAATRATWDGVVGAGKDALVEATAAATMAAAAALAALAVIGSDGYLSRGEKPAAIIDWNDVSGTEADLTAKATGLGITTELTRYTAAVAALATYLSALVPSWVDTTQDTAIDAATWAALWREAYDSRVALLNAMTAKAATTATALTLAQSGGALLLDPGTGVNTAVATDSRLTGQTFAGGVQQVYSIEPLSATSTSSSATITIAAHTVTYSGAVTVSYSGGSIAGLAPGVTYAVYDDDPTFAGGTRSYVATTNFSVLAANTGRRLVGYIATPAAGSGGTGTGTGGGTGGGGRPGPGGAIP